MKDTKKLYFILFDRIRDYILDNNLVAGDRLPTEHEMCELFNVSRNSLREAVKTLEIMGMIKSKPGVGIVVQEYSMDFLFDNMFYKYASDSKKLVHEMLDVRKVLEMGFMRQAFESIKPEQISDLRSILDEMEMKYLKGEVFHDEDRRFHMLLFSNINNSTLNSIFATAWNVDAHFNMENKRMFLKSLFTHVDIVNSLESRDYHLFHSNMEKHFSEEIYLIGKGYK